MIDWAGGLFTGLMLAFILIILGIEFYFLIFEKIIDKETSISETLIFSCLFLISIILVVKKLSLLAIFIPPLGLVFIRFLQEKKENIITKRETEERIKELKEIISQQPNNFKSYEELANFYFKEEDYENALKLYKTAYKLKDLPSIKQKIEITERQIKIKNQIIWICRNCGEDNLKESERCKNCGQPKEVLKSIKEDLKQTKKYFIFLLITPFFVLIAFVIYIYLPLYISLFIFLLLLYFVIRFFLTY
ncbi:MAG: hypothetical protein NC915_02795 [Candidatus Omnitrophica bacterium]|nr:hypothetical protein [Candidatus Omnitrophota bacterium]